MAKIDNAAVRAVRAKDPTARPLWDRVGENEARVTGILTKVGGNREVLVAISYEDGDEFELFRETSIDELFADAG